ncbi:MAG: hypothetical protein J6A74_05230 [Oscillospiraceae bacterium]|nr:hypothetical protein [Oscillospiraceae bacterium]
MGKQKRLFSWFALFSIFLILILDVKCAISGVSGGIDLCLRTVIPAIFPFLILSPLLLAQTPDLSLLHPVGTLLRIPKGSESIMVSSFLCGYPVGAQMVSNSWKSGQLTTSDARRMLAFCNNAGPAFIFGIGGSLFSEKWAPWVLWLIHILSALVVGVVLPGNSSHHSFQFNNKPTSFRKNLENSVVTMGYICGWVILFRTIAAFLQRWILWFFPKWAEIMIFGFLELSSGCTSAHSLNDPVARFLLLSAFFSFGGICVHMQTASVTSGLKATIPYLTGKLLHCSFSILLSAIFLLFTHFTDASSLVPFILAIDIPLLVITIFTIRTKKGSFMQLCGV